VVLVVVRFSNFAGLPNIADSDPMASPRGMVVKFYLPDWSETDIIAHSYNGFPTKTASEFKDLLLALAAAGDPGASKPAALNQFLSTRPIAKAFLEASKPAPVSYATIPYFGVNTFKFTNVRGGVTFGRYQIRPAAPEQYLSSEQLANQSGDYLVNEIAERVSAGAVKFKLLLQVADEGDTLDDPSIAWPDSRPIAELGTIQMSMPTAQPINADRKVLFSPGNLVDGIEAADPMISARSGAYGVDFERRTKS
jgi:catalase